ncbi:MAG: acetyl-CoA synthetase [Ruminococcaceae bacterium]|nr:acetyl-CoA synthetase [Oscillospiraceae bacterium]
MRVAEKFANMSFESYEDFKKNFKINIPENFNFARDVIDDYAQNAPDQKALVWCNDEGQEKIFTFSDISRLSKKAANALRSLGIKKGDRVLLMVKRRYQYWYINPAICRLGAVIIPATHQLTEKDIKYRIQKANVSLIIVANDPYLTNALNDLKPQMPDVKMATISGKCDGFIDFDELVEKASEDFVEPTGDEMPKNNDLMLLYFTSGTTGMPKMVAHNFVYPLGHILTAGFWQNLKETDLHLSLADTGWAKCSWGKLYGQWIMGAAVFVYDYESKFQPIEIAQMIEKYHITTFCAPPTVFRFLIKEDLSGIDLSSLRATYNAGESLNPEVYRQWYNLTGIKLREGFGQTETPVIVACFPWFEPRPGSMGKPSPILNAKLINPRGEICEVGEEGEICIDLKNGIPTGVFYEYHEEKEMTSSVMFDGLYHTGDVAWCDEDGYFWFIGRSDDVIKSSGYRIGPFEVESALVEHPAVLETAITAVPDPVRGQIVKATIVLANGYTPSEELKVELQQHVKRVTAPYKYPRIIEFVNELPKTISGKIRRVQIRNEDAEK